MFTRLTQCFLSCCPDVTDDDANQPSQSLLSAQQPVPSEALCGSSATSVAMSMTRTRSLLPAQDETKGSLSLAQTQSAPSHKNSSLVNAGSLNND